jgi:hypothetical protein
VILRFVNGTRRSGAACLAVSITLSGTGIATFRQMFTSLLLQTNYNESAYKKEKARRGPLAARNSALQRGRSPDVALLIFGPVYRTASQIIKPKWSMTRADFVRGPCGACLLATKWHNPLEPMCVVQHAVCSKSAVRAYVAAPARVGSRMRTRRDQLEGLSPTLCVRYNGERMREVPKHCSKQSPEMRHGFRDQRSVAGGQLQRSFA